MSTSVSTASTTAPDRLLLRLAPLVLVVFLAFLTIGLPLPALPHQVHEALGYGPIVVGVVMGIQSLVTVASRSLGGSICDAEGPRAAVLYGLPAAMLAGLAYLASGFLVSAPLLSLAVLLAGRCILGFAESLFATGTLTWGIVTAGPSAAGKAMAWQGIAMYAALGLGAPAGLAMQQSSGFASVSAGVIALPALAMLIILALPKPAHLGAARGGSFFQAVRLIWPFGLGLALGTISYAGMAAFLPLHFSAHHWGGAGIAFLIFAVCYIGVRLLFAHLPDRVGGGQVAIVSLLIVAVGQLVLWRATSEALAIGGAALTGAGYSLIFPSFGVQAIRKTPPEMRGLAVGAFMAFFDVAIGFGGPLCGLAAARFGYPSVFLLGAVAAAGSVALTVVVGRKAAA
jgi:MFS family permease